MATTKKWYKKQTADWTDSAQDLVTKLRKALKKHRKKAEKTDDPDHRQWHEDRAKDHEEHIELVRSQRERVAKFLKKYEIELPELDFGP